MNKNTENALDNLLLSQIREHVGKSISLYKRLLKAGVEKKKARLMLTEYFVNIEHSGVEDFPREAV